MAKSTAPSLKNESDSPTTVDLLGFDRLVSTVAERIAHAADGDTPLTIGIYGEWGAGKSSFLEMVSKGLQKEGISPVWFNAWKYEKEKDLLVALIQTILNQAQIKGRWHRRLYVKVRVWLSNIAVFAGTWELLKSLISFLLRIAAILVAFTLVFRWNDIADWMSQISIFGITVSASVQPFFQFSATAIAIVVAVISVNPAHLFNAIAGAKLGFDFSKFQRKRSYSAHIV